MSLDEKEFEIRKHAWICMRAEYFRQRDSYELEAHELENTAKFKIRRECYEPAVQDSHTRQELCFVAAV